MGGRLSWEDISTISDKFDQEDDIVAEVLNDYPELEKEHSGSEDEEDIEDEDIPPQFMDDEDALFTRPESVAIWMPSRHPSSTPVSLFRQEQMLRESQAHEALQGI